MAKKLAVILLALAMMLGVFGLAGCDNVSLADYKVTKSNESQDYAEAKGQSNYSENGWEAVCKVVIDGKAAIMDAATKPAVSTVFDEAKTVINTVERKEIGMGKFYTLQEAYDAGWLTQDDLRSIAHYQSAGKDEPNFTPAQMNPEVLSSKTIEAIKEAYLKGLLAATHQDGSLLFPNATISDINFLAYYGTYGGVVAIKVSDEFSGYAGVVVELVVASVTFTYSGVAVAIFKAN